MYPSIQISFNLKDLPLALLIQKNLGHGSISRIKKSATYNYTINNKTGLLLLIGLVNGYFRTPKLIKFNSLICYFNDLGYDIESFTIDTSQIISNAWLSGFIDANGSFQIRFIKMNKYSKVVCNFEIEQRQIDMGQSWFGILDIIAQF